MKAFRFAFGIALALSWSLPVSAATLSPPGASSCTGCHAVKEIGPPAIPRIYGRSAEEIMTAMAAFRDGTRPSTVMNRIAKGFSDDELRPIAAWLATQQ